MIKRVMNVLTILAILTSVLFCSVLDFSIQVLLVSLIILLPVVLAINYILFGKITIWHDSKEG